MAYNELFALAFVAPYLASGKRIPPQTIQEMMRRSLYHIKWYFARTDLNTDRGKAENKKSIMKYVKWYTPEKERQYPTSFKVDFVGQPYEGACYYRITRCPVCAYAEKLGVTAFCTGRRRSLAAGTAATTSLRETRRKLPAAHVFWKNVCAAKQSGLA